jgi:hypothetical protein
MTHDFQCVQTICLATLNPAPGNDMLYRRGGDWYKPGIETSMSWRSHL